jgi:serine/threonine-protein kinase
VQPGDVFDDRYELGEIIGSGGTGTVWRARDTVLARDVAVKVLRVGELGDEVQRARLRGEAQLAGGLNHPAIGQVFDYGVVEEAPYIVMGLVRGVPLSKVLREERRLAPARVMRIVSQLAGGLEMAHQAGIVHRDLKPANVMIDEDDRAVLLDFGIARAATDEPLTATGTIVGTVDYISPEQAAGGSATAHSDLYGLGMVAYECLSGQRPFRRESQVATALAHLHEEAPPLPDDVPVGVRNLVAALIAKDPAARSRRRRCSTTASPRSCRRTAWRR